MQDPETTAHRLDTHWTRILYHDLFTRAAHAEAPRASNPKETFMALEDLRHHEAPFAGRSPLASAAVLLAIYVAMYLAVAGIMQMVSPADASAPDDSVTQSQASSTAPDGHGADHENVH